MGRGTAPQRWLLCILFNLYIFYYTCLFFCYSPPSYLFVSIIIFFIFFYFIISCSQDLSDPPTILYLIIFTTSFPNFHHQFCFPFPLSRSFPLLSLNLYHCIFFFLFFFKQPQEYITVFLNTLFITIYNFFTTSFPNFYHQLCFSFPLHRFFPFFSFHFHHCIFFFHFFLNNLEREQILKQKYITVFLNTLFISAPSPCALLHKFRVRYSFVVSYEESAREDWQRETTQST